MPMLKQRLELSDSACEALCPQHAWQKHDRQHLEKDKNLQSTWMEDSVGAARDLTALSLSLKQSRAWSMSCRHHLRLLSHLDMEVHTVGGNTLQRTFQRRGVVRYPLVGETRNKQHVQKIFIAVTKLFDTSTSIGDKEWHGRFASDMVRSQVFNLGSCQQTIQIMRSTSVYSSRMQTRCDHHFYD